MHASAENTTPTSTLNPTRPLDRFLLYIPSIPRLPKARDTPASAPKIFVFDRWQLPRTITRQLGGVKLGRFSWSVRTVESAWEALVLAGCWKFHPLSSLETTRLAADQIGPR